MIGHIVGNYKIEERVMSKELYTIYVATDTIFGNKVYLKILSHKMSDNAGAKKRYLEEAGNYLKLTHPNILKLLNAEEGDGFTYLAYEYYPHKNLDEYLADNHNLTIKDLTDIFFQACAAIDYAHQHCVIHKNITPACIFLDSSGKLKLGDFGVSFVELIQTEISSNQILEDFYYFSPEKLKEENLDERADIYSLGIILFYLLSKRYPFDEPNLESLINAKIEGRIKDIASYNHNDGPEFSGIIGKLLSKDKNERYLNINQVLDAVNKTKFGFSYKIDISPKQANWFINKARQDYMARRLDLSAEQWEKAASFDPYNPNIHISLAKLYAETNNTPKAIEHYNTAIEVSPYKYKWRNELAVLYKKNNQYDRAINEYGFIKKLDKSFVNFYFNYGNCLFYMKKYDEAVSVWNEALKYDKDNLKYFYNIGVANYFLNKQDQAVKNWREVTAINSKFVKAIYNLSIAELNAGNYNNAFKLWSEVDKIAGLSYLKLNLGNHYYKQVNFESALDYWNTAINLDKNSWHAYFNIAIYYFDKDKNKSKEMFEKTVQIKPDLWASLWNLGYIAKENNDMDAAETFFNKVLELKPDYWQANYYLGEKFLKDGNTEEAQKYFLKIMNAAREDLDNTFYKNMGIIFYKNNEKEKALDWFIKSVAHRNFQWDTSIGIPDNVYKASKIIVEKELKEKGDSSNLLLEDDVKLSLKPELTLAECKEINTIIDY